MKMGLFFTIVGLGLQFWIGVGNCYLPLDYLNEVINNLSAHEVVINITDYQFLLNSFKYVKGNDIWNMPDRITYPYKPENKKKCTGFMYQTCIETRVSSNMISYYEKSKYLWELQNEYIILYNDILHHTRLLYLLNFITENQNKILLTCKVPEICDNKVIYINKNEYRARRNTLKLFFHTTKSERSDLYLLNTNEFQRLLVSNRFKLERAMNMISELLFLQNYIKNNKPNNYQGHHY